MKVKGRIYFNPIPFNNPVLGVFPSFVESFVSLVELGPCSLGVDRSECYDD
jgi:hypothetical protein